MCDSTKNKSLTVTTTQSFYKTPVYTNEQKIDKHCVANYYIILLFEIILYELIN